MNSLQQHRSSSFDVMIDKNLFGKGAAASCRSARGMHLQPNAMLDYPGLILQFIHLLTQGQNKPKRDCSIATSVGSLGYASTLNSQLHTLPCTTWERLPYVLGKTRDLQWPRQQVSAKANASFADELLLVHTTPCFLGS